MPPAAEKPEFSIPIQDLDAGGESFDFPVPAAWMRAAFEGTPVAPLGGGADGHLSLRLSKSGTDVVVRGSLSADLVVPCARCLEPARVPVREEVSVLAVPRAAMREAAGGDDDLDPTQADMIPYDGETLVLDDLVRDELLLAVPMIPLCSEGCEGISPRSPTNPGDEPASAIDPRLRPLLRFKKST